MVLRMMWDASLGFLPPLQRYCTHCDMHTIGVERHVVFESPALQCIRARFPGLFGAAVTTMRQAITQVGTFIMQCFARMTATDTEGNVGSSNQP